LSAAAIAFTYRYSFASGLSDSKQELGLTLATCGLSHEHPHFSDGQMREPQVVGCLLLAVSEVARTHYFLPRPPLVDPVVTSNEAVLRFEGFSGFCGVYARADLSAQAFDRDIQGWGTTNVDFNNPMRTALSRPRDGDEVRLAVGREEVALERGEELQPRLQGARRLLARDGERITETHGSRAWDVAVQNSQVTHQVRLRPESDRCTCPWFSRHRGKRGPCKHVLAARLLADGEQDGEGEKGP